LRGIRGGDGQDQESENGENRVHVHLEEKSVEPGLWVGVPGIEGLFEGIYARALSDVITNREVQKGREDCGNSISFRGLSKWGCLISLQKKSKTQEKKLQKIKKPIDTEL
jgi:hypothetical protein